MTHHDAEMRLTLTLDADVARLIDEEVHRAQKPMKAVVNDALRRGLSPSDPRRRLEPYRVHPHVARLRPGQDGGSMNALAEELEDQA